MTERTMMDITNARAAQALLDQRRAQGEALRRALVGSETDTSAPDLCRGGESEFCWGTIWQRPALPHRTRAALALAMVAAKGSMSSTRDYVNVALKTGWSPAEIEEILLHTQCYAGLSTSLDAMDAAKEVLAEKCPGYQPGSPADTASIDEEVSDPNALQRMGLTIRREVLGADMVDQSERRTRDDPFISMFFDVTHEYCFAKIWGRPALDRRLRSMLSLGIASTLGQSGAINRHVRSAVEIGLTQRQIGEILLQAYVYGGVYSALNGFLVAKETFTAMNEEGIDIPGGFGSEEDTPPL